MRLGAGTAVQYAPLVQNTTDGVSRITIENVSDETAMCVETSYYNEGGLTPVAVDPPGPAPTTITSQSIGRASFRQY